MAARRSRGPSHLVHRLVLNEWVLARFGVPDFQELATLLRDEALEGLDENNVHRFHHVLVSALTDLSGLTPDLLLEYDQNIVGHTRRLNEGRLARSEEPVTWKYFQYLALLFTEVYLDRYFRDPDGLLLELNRHIDQWNGERRKADRVPVFDEGAEAWLQLNKLTFWMATGSGKTLLMHANILQFRHYLERHGHRRELNRVLLLTPNAGLSQQHLREFEAAGIDAEIFDKEGRGLFAGHAVEILEITKLREEMGDTTVAVEAFEENNLVLVDEGHRGASGGSDGTWMRFRNALCERGFSFEYSATFGQAVKGSPALAESYARNILVDYSYRHFYRDGFGKDYQILNLDRATQRDHLELYLVAGLLSFFQQQRLFQTREDDFRPFQIEKPLWIFVGGSVTKTLAKRDASDIIEILDFLGRYVSDRSGSLERIRRVLDQGLVTATGRNLFSGRFPYLNTCGLAPEEIFAETLEMLFHARAGGRLYVENLKGAEGEVALRLGADNPPFGVVNVGDDAKLVRLCENDGMATGDREFSGSLFHEISDADSTVNVLIGSKKFTEGWSSWRVSTMGLMNVGRGEGAQIIQLFGRGVRLKGYDTSLKRSGRTELPEGVERPKYVEVLETLGIFGVHATWPSSGTSWRTRGFLPTKTARRLCCRSSGAPARRSWEGSRPSGSSARSVGSRPRRATPSNAWGPCRPCPGPAAAGVPPWTSSSAILWSSTGTQDPGHALGGAGGWRPARLTQRDAPSSAPRRLPRPGSPPSGARAVQGGAGVAQPEPPARRSRGAPRGRELVPPPDSGGCPGVRFVRERTPLAGDRGEPAPEVLGALLRLPEAGVGGAGGLAACAAVVALFSVFGIRSGAFIQTAVLFGMERGVRLTLEVGADPNSPGLFYDPPLYTAVRNGSVELVEVLLDQGADPGVREPDPGSPHSTARRATGMARSSRSSSTRAPTCMPRRGEEARP